MPLRMKPLVDVSYLREILIYDPDTGLFTWRVKKCNRLPIGAPAGSLQKNGYRSISIDAARRAAEKLYFGEFRRNRNA